MSLDETRTKSLAIWDEMAAGWDKHSAYLWETGRQVGEWMVEKIDPKPGQTILELAAGPGVTGFVAAKLIGDRGNLISTDFAPHMVEVAQKVATGLGVTNAEFRVMDAENIDLPDDSVDGVLCRWGLMLMMSPLVALKEIRRVLKPGGKLAFSVWGSPKDNMWATVAGIVMVSLGKMEMPDPNATGSMFSMAEKSTIDRMVGDAGFTKWEIEPIVVAWKFAGKEEHWSFLNDVAGAVSLLLREMDENSLVEVREALRGRLADFREGDGYAIPGVAINVVAE